MARNQTILQGFVNINLETNEKSFYIRESEKVMAPSVNRVVSRTNRDLNPPITIEELAKKIGVNSINIENAHVQGSRLYGVSRLNSDWDLSVIVSSNIPYKFYQFSHNEVDFDVHVYNRENFDNKIKYHNMRELEFVFHPKEARLIDKFPKIASISRTFLSKQVIIESDDLWNRGRNILEKQTRDPYIAKKDFWHSIRFLIFAKQIIQNGRITDFSGANYLYDEIVLSKETNFSYFNDKISKIREDLKQEIKNLL